MSEPENDAAHPELVRNQNAPTPSATNRAMSRPIFMPETFTGIGRDWEDWAEQFEMAADVNNWDEPLRLKFMGLLLSGRAREVYSGLSAADKTSYTSLKNAMGRCLDPSDSDDWNRVNFSSRKRLHNESVRDFGIALRRLVARAYPFADPNTQDLLAKDHFISHVGSGDLRISLRSAKPATLEAAINLASELELIRGLENSHLAQDAKVRGVSEQKTKDNEQVETLLGVVEGLRQEVKSLQAAVQVLKINPTHPASTPLAASAPLPQPANAHSSTVANQEVMQRGGGCWECGCNRHIRRNCPYLQGN